MSVAKIAEMAGVSRMTVSRVINKDARVRPQTAALVREAIVKLNYVPPSPRVDGRRRRSRSVSGLHTGRIAMLIPDTSADAMRTTLSGRLLHGIDGPIERHSLQLLLARLPAPGELPSFIDRRQVDGVIVRSGDAPWLPTALQDIPSVWIFEGNDSGGSRDRVDADDRAIGRLAADYLQGRGHQRLAVVDHLPKHVAHHRRRESFIQCVESRCNTAVFLRLEGIDADSLGAPVRRLMESDDHPTGIFLPGTGPIISRVQHAVCDAGCKPGQSVELIGCGHDHHLIEAMYPQPANLDIQPEAIGEAAIELLLWRLAHPAAACRSIVLQPKLCESPDVSN